MLLSHETYCYIAIICITIYAALRLQSYRNTLHKQNIQLIHLYLDKKFMTKLLILISSNNSNSGNTVHDSILSNIQEYFQLDDIIVCDKTSCSIMDSTCRMYRDDVYKKNMVTKSVEDYIRAVHQSLEDSQITCTTLRNEDGCMILYILPIASRDHTMIFIQYGNDVSLRKYEIDTLKDLIMSISIRYKSPCQVQHQS